MRELAKGVGIEAGYLGAFSTVIGVARGLRGRVKSVAFLGELRGSERCGWCALLT